jgi:hypothetical protein
VVCGCPQAVGAGGEIEIIKIEIIFSYTHQR